jgi:predicted outer membrane repeat protein
MFRLPFRRFAATQSRHRTASPRRKPSRLRLRIEALEDRLTPSTFTVTNLLDSGAGSLRSAISQANLAGQGVVNFATGLNGTISLNSELPITSNLRIDDSAATGGTGPHKITVSAPHSGGRDFDIIGGVHVSFIGDPVTSTTGFIIQGGSNVNNGGGIVAFSPQSSVTLVGVDVRNNSATGSGGGIFVFGSLGIYNSTVESNTALFNGGGIFVGKTFGAYNSSIHDNSTTGGDGGGVYEFGTGSTMVFSNTLVQNNHAVGGAGGGAWAQYNLTSKGSVFTQNTATRNGGGIFSNNGNVYLLSFAGSSGSSPSVVSNNSAGGDGGGVWADHTVYSDGGAVLGNSALGGGGGIYSLVGPVAVINGSLVQGNQAIGTSTISAAAGLGGGIFTDGDVFVLTGSTVGGTPTSSSSPGNIAAADGGGIYSLKSVHLAFATVDGNIAGGEAASVAGNGGGVFAVQQIFVIDSHVDFNQANNGDGGGLADQRGNIYVLSVTSRSSAIPPISGSQITHNQAINGGGIWDVVGSVQVTFQTNIDHNVASNDGGGIWIGTNGSLRVDTSTVSNNQAVHGGGIAAEGADEVTIFQSRIIFNKATAPPGSDAGGGMLAANVSDLSITYSTFASNAATSGNGGALALVATVGFPGGANAGLDNDTFGGFTDPNTGLVTPNSAGGFGGAIYVRNVTVDIIHLTFNDNVAFGGTGVTAGHAGSDIYADTGSAVTFEDTLFDDTNNFANPTLNPGSSELLDTAFAGGLLSAGYNLVHDGSWANVTNWNPLNGDIGNGHQDLGPLTFNQASPPGPTFTETYALVDAAGEQAIDAGDDVGPQLDQNGRLRPVGLPSDIGSTQDE